MVEMSECPHCGRKAAVRLYCHDCVTRCMDTGRAVRLVCNVVRGGCGVDLDRRTVFSMLTLIPGAAA